MLQQYSLNVSVDSLEDSGIMKLKEHEWNVKFLMASNVMENELSWASRNIHALSRKTLLILHWLLLLLLLHPFYRPLDLVQDYPGEPVPERWNQEGKTKLDLLEQEIVSGSGISWAICKSAPCPRHNNHANIPPLSFLQAGCPSCQPTNSVKALKAHNMTLIK